MKQKILYAIQILVIGFFAFLLIENYITRKDQLPPKEIIGKKKIVYKDSVYEVMTWVDTVYSITGVK